MKRLSVLGVALVVSLSTTAAFGRGGAGSSHGGMGSFHSGMGLSHMSMTGMSMTSSVPGMRATGGAFGTSAAAPGTNSLGTALPSSDSADKPIKGTQLGSDSAIVREEAKVDKMIGSICRGC
jgi:hypothetical protein